MTKADAPATYTVQFAGTTARQEVPADRFLTKNMAFGAAAIRRPGTYLMGWYYDDKTAGRYDGGLFKKEGDVYRQVGEFYSVNLTEAGRDAAVFKEGIYSPDEMTHSLYCTAGYGFFLTAQEAATLEEQLLNPETRFSHARARYQAAKAKSA